LLYKRGINTIDADSCPFNGGFQYSGLLTNSSSKLFIIISLLSFKHSTAKQYFSSKDILT
jgi:hypothetical protein